MALHEVGRRAWALDLPPYMPHLSLLYSEVTEEQKQSIIDSLDIPLPLTVHVDAVELWADDHLGVRGWRRVARVPFSCHGRPADQGHCNRRILHFGPMAFASR